MPDRSDGTADPPLVSIVTVNLNQAAGLARTMESVFSQSHRNIEFIIIDGGSTDGSIEYIEDHGEGVTHWVSEADRGIYDAMNKGIRKATGDWIGFMNSGDSFYAENTIKRSLAGAPSGADLIYGDTVYVRGSKEIPIHARPLDRLWRGSCFSHQSVLCRTMLLKKTPFNLALDIVADYEFFLSCYMRGLNFHYCGDFTAVFELGGRSDVHVLQRTIERWRVVRGCRPGMSTDLFYLLLSARSLIQQIWRRIGSAFPPARS